MSVRACYRSPGNASSLSSTNVEDLPCQDRLQEFQRAVPRLSAFSLGRGSQQDQAN